MAKTYTLADLKGANLQKFSREELFTLEHKTALHNRNLNIIAREMGLSPSAIGAFLPLCDQGADKTALAASVANQLARTESLMASMGDGAKEAPAFQFTVSLLAGSAAATESETTPAKGAAANSSGKKPTLTEQVLASRGVKTLAELNALAFDDGGVSLDDSDKKSDEKKDEDEDEKDEDKEDDEKRNDDDEKDDENRKSKQVKSSVTAQVLAAKGVKTLAQLNAKHQARMNSGADAAD